jgi:hypothetical protein
MQKYVVIVHGQNLLADVEGVRQRLGFFTNVSVEAFTPADAEARAIDLVRDDAYVREIALNGEDDPYGLSSAEVHEVEDFDEAGFPRTGLALYPEKSGET